MRKKLLLSYVVIILAAVGISMFISWTKGYSYMEQQTREYHMIQAELLADTFAETKFSSYREFVKTYSEKYKVRITIIDDDGVVWADSDTTEQLENHSTREEVVRALKGEHVTVYRYSKTMKQKYAYSAVPINNSYFSGVMRVSLPVKEMRAFDQSLIETIVFTILLCMVGATILALVFSRYFTKPIEEMTEAAERISEGDYDAKIYTRDRYQVGRLADSFNRMSKNLNHSMNALKKRNIEFDAMLKSMESGVIAVDREDTVMFTNDVFKEMLGCEGEEIVHKPFYETVRNAMLFELISEVRKKKETIRSERTLLSSGEKTIRVTATPLIRETTDELGVLLIVEDITKIRKLENMRRDFVSNVSHELKTPLTSIRGFVDTLKCGAIADEKVANHFLDIIDMESERLASLIEDILLLSEIESKQECERQTCDVNQIITEVVELLQKNSKEKPVTIQYVPKQNLPLYLANPNRIKQLVINLLDNAIKYTEEGCVEVVCEKQEDDLVLIVSDTGIGMEQEHLERIFERFYRVDKGRSRKMGGTGLGLSIVKHIIERYRGSVKVESRLNVGTKFTVRLPYEG